VHLVDDVLLFAAAAAAAAAVYSCSVTRSSSRHRPATTTVVRSVQEERRAARRLRVSSSQGRPGPCDMPGALQLRLPVLRRHRQRGTHGPLLPERTCRRVHSKVTQN